MRCFNHSEVRAVGLCKHCSKALCHECITDFGFGLACRGVHEQEVTSVHGMVEQAARVQAISRSNKYLSSLFFVVFGSFFVCYELYTGNAGAGFGLWLGGLFIAYGLYLAMVVRKTYSRAKA